MPSTSDSLTPQALAQLLWGRRGLWLRTAVAGAAVAALVAFGSPRSWRASQGFLIRGEAAGYAQQRLGKFTDLSEMKTVQETLLELARSESVVTATLREAGPPSGRWSTGWPSRADVEEFRDSLAITPPGGAEFGKTEVFYLCVQGESPERAAKLAASAAGQLELRMQQLRDERATSMVQELEQSVEAADAQLAKSVAELSAYERSLGADLPELRNLVTQFGGTSELAQRSLSIETEYRQVEADTRRNEQLLRVLHEAAADPRRLLATPGALLASQPALQRLKDGLVDAQLGAATLRGVRSADHPLVAAAEEALAQIKAEVSREVPVAIAGVKMELSLAEQRKADLSAELAKVGATHRVLATQRSKYARLVADVDNQMKQVDAARNQLSEAESARAAALASSVLSRIDRVETDDRPVGPGRVVTTAAGGLAGLLLGVGLVVTLWLPAPQGPAGRARSEGAADRSGDCVAVPFAPIAAAV